MPRRHNRQSRKRIRDPRLPKRSALAIHAPGQGQPQKGWKEISELNGFSQRTNHGKIKLCVDHDVPRYLAQHLDEEFNIPFYTAIEAGLDRDDDEKIRQWARREKRLLLTFNHTDFWNDQKHPLLNAPGIVMVRVPRKKTLEVAQALQLVLVEFARYFPLNWWAETKVRLTTDLFSFKRQSGGRQSRFAVKYNRNRLFFRMTSKG